MMQHVVRTAALLAAGCVFIAGCTKPGFGDVEGTVSYNGKPLPAGILTFTSEDDVWAATGSLKGDGTFKIAHVPAGLVRVVVDTEAFRNIMDEKTAADLRKRGLPAPVYDEKVEGFRYVKIPEKYADRATSDLRIEVKKNQLNRVDIELK